MFRRLPVEWFVVFVPYLLLVGYFFIINSKALFTVGAAGTLFLSTASLFLWSLIALFVLYSLYALAAFFLQIVKQSISRQKLISTDTVQSVVVSLLGVMAVYFSTFYLHTLLMNALSIIHTPADIYANSALLASSDRWLLGEWSLAGVLAWTSTFPWLQTSLVTVYGALSLVSGPIALLVFLKSVRLFRCFMIALYAAFFIAIIFWHAMPAISPSQFMLEDAVGPLVSELDQTQAARLQTALDEATPHLQRAHAKYVKLWQGKPLAENVRNEFAITTNPSFHVALGLLCVYFLWQVNRWLGVLLGVFQVLNMFSTIVLLQHYFVDMWLGSLVAIVAIVVANRALWFEEQQLTVQAASYFKVLYLCRADVLALVTKLVPKSGPLATAWQRFSSASEK